jgi:threonine dehydrogenase-like Zn-dependent dehydrogenase
MRAICWTGVGDLSLEQMPDPAIINPGDAIVRVTMSATCGSDLHIINGYIPTMREGDIIGHEFMGQVVDTGPDVQGIKKGTRVVIPSPISCGVCWYCRKGMFSLCDNTNPNPELQEPILGFPTAGIYGYTHAFGGYPGSHAEFIRIPFADQNCFVVPGRIA